MKKFVIGSIIVLLTSTLFASEPSQQLDGFFHAMQKMEVNKAFSSFDVFANSKEDQLSIEKMKSNIKKGLPDMGNPLGYEMIKEENYGKSIKRYVYLLKFDQGLVLWEFFFYKSKDDWKLKMLNYTTNISAVKL